MLPDERDRLIDECFRLERDYRANEYGEADHKRKAHWHELRWRILERVVKLIEGREAK